MEQPTFRMNKRSDSKIRLEETKIYLQYIGFVSKFAYYGDLGALDIKGYQLQTKKNRKRKKERKKER